MSDVQRFRVTVEAHRLEPRFEVPASSRVVWAEDVKRARYRGLRAAHIDAQVPGLRSLMRVSWPFVSAVSELEPADKLQMELPSAA